MTLSRNVFSNTYFSFKVGPLRVFIKIIFKLYFVDFENSKKQEIYMKKIVHCMVRINLSGNTPYDKKMNKIDYYNTFTHKI